MAQRGAMKASEHVVADRIVGSLVHCLRVAGENGKGLGGLPFHVENVGLHNCSHNMQ